MKFAMDPIVQIFALGYLVAFTLSPWYGVGICLGGMLFDIVAEIARGIRDS